MASYSVNNMISSVQNRPPQTKSKPFNTCIHNNTNRNSSILVSEIYSKSAESPTSNMSTLTASVTASAVNNKPITKPPMEAVIVNSIIYSKPSFCRISVDLGNEPVRKKATTTKKLNGCSNNMDCFNETNCSSSMDSPLNFDAISCLAGMAASSSLVPGEDTKLYRMCTTLNGSIHHQISDLCDNILAMAGFYSNTIGENDDDSFIEFGYRDEGNEDYNDDDEEEDDDEEDYYSDEVDDDNDVVDFSYECPIEPAPKLYCDKRKKVRFNNKPTVHKMHTWSYAYRAARKGEWEMFARDRERFKLRIQRTALSLNPILEREHRQKIYEKRFASLYTENDSQNEVSVENLESKETSVNTEPKKPHQKTKRRKKRFVKMGNKHYF